MTLNLPLSPEQEEAVRREAERRGQTVTDFAMSRLLGADPVHKPTGAEVLKNLQAAGVIGTFADRPDSPEWARELRDAAERRGA